MSTLPQGQPESRDWILGGRSLDLAEPMTAEETAADHVTVLGIISWVYNSLTLWPPAGLRHHARTTKGAIVRNCVLLEHDLVEQGSVVPSELSQYFSEPEGGAEFRPLYSFRKMMSLGGRDGSILRTPFAAGLQQPLFPHRERPMQVPEEEDAAAEMMDEEAVR